MRRFGRLDCFVTMQREGVMRQIMTTVALLVVATAAQAGAVFPTAVSDKYADEKPEKALQRTCVDQYMVNKATNSNDGMLWQQKGGGGYYAECKKRIGPPSTKRLKAKK
jgi:hypothetical protein